VSNIRLGSESIATAHGVEPPDEFRIGVPGFGRCNLFDTIPVPKTAGAPKGSKPALSGDAGAGEDKEAIMESQMHKCSYAIMRYSMVMPKRHNAVMYPFGH
jgi:hypothetical protein